MMNSGQNRSARNCRAKMRAMPAALHRASKLAHYAKSGRARAGRCSRFFAPSARRPALHRLQERELARIVKRRASPPCLENKPKKTQRSPPDFLRNKADGQCHYSGARRQSRFHRASQPALEISTVHPPASRNPFAAKCRSVSRLTHRYSITALPASPERAVQSECALP
jgi:hypothetical protein